MKTYKLYLTEHEVNTILHGLGAMPYTQSATIIDSVREQLETQEPTEDDDHGTV